jgi:hypothetical protein
LENLTGHDLDLKTIPEFYLQGVQETYTSPTDIVQNKPIDIKRVSIKDGVDGLEPVPLTIHLDKQGGSTFEVDAAKTKWDREISSVWPSRSLRSLLPGPYSLRLEFEDAAGRLVRSNEVKVVLTKAESH